MIPSKRHKHDVQPPVFGSPFKLVSGDAFSAPSAVLPKVQEVDNSELNVSESIIFFSPLFYEYFCFLQVVKDFTIESFVSELSIE